MMLLILAIASYVITYFIFRKIIKLDDFQEDSYFIAMLEGDMILIGVAIALFLIPFANVILYGIDLLHLLFMNCNTRRKLIKKIFFIKEEMIEDDIINTNNDN